MSSTCARKGSLTNWNQKVEKCVFYDGYPKGIVKDCFGSHKEDKMFANILMMTMWIILKNCSRWEVGIFCKTTIKYI